MMSTNRPFTAVRPAALVTVLLLCLPPHALAAEGDPVLQDPTRPNWYGLKAKARKAASELQLSSIIISANRRLAVINGDLMREGERRNGVLLKEVLKDRVLVVSADKGLRALRLPVPQPVKESS
ncbi:MAG: hypothetical protein AAGI15_01625 [Pseudomonadota bacterium]